MLDQFDQDRIEAAWRTVRSDLLAERDTPTADGGSHWTGELAASALATATAVSALAIFQSHLPNDEEEAAVAAGDAPSYEQIEALISLGLNWLADHQNEDGGWGDTNLSHSNIATTMLVRAAFQINGVPVDHNDLAERADHYIERFGGIAGLRRRYGKDKTFAIPILANCALAGMVDWREVSPLPFELACLPQSWYRFMRLPVVSYAIPALVAVGQARYFFKPPLNPISRLIRGRATKKSLAVLEQMQPASGGYLEAVPLTSFVVMCLAGMGHFDQPVVRRGIDYLLKSARADGSWPIDTNLATWVTTLSVNALHAGGEDVRELDCLPWILSCQQRERHPFTGAEPGGWAWTDLSGGVPDADDTAGALLALAAYRDSETEQSPNDPEASQNLITPATEGVDWLLKLQNSDGGWPTFCRGWGKLPFDRSGSDLTAHVLRALDTWRDRLESTHEARIAQAMQQGMEFLLCRQRADGSWLPLWFGNQDRPDDENPVFGTTRVLLAFRDLGQMKTPAARRGVHWLCDAQNGDGGWGAPLPSAPTKRGVMSPVRYVSTVEETALAVETLLSVPDRESDARLQHVLRQGLQWLANAVEANRHRECSPIGFYFAKLWYYERLYPLVFTAAALGTAVAQSREQQTSEPQLLERTWSSPMAGRGARESVSPPTAPSART